MTLLLPSVVTVFLALGIRALISEIKWWNEPESASADEVVEEGPHRSKPHAAILYTCIQAVAFTALAIMIMRMKLFMTPQLCIGKLIKSKTKLNSKLNLIRN